MNAVLPQTELELVLYTFLRHSFHYRIRNDDTRGEALNSVKYAIAFLDGWCEYEIRSHFNERFLNICEFCWNFDRNFDFRFNLLNDLPYYLNWDFFGDLANLYCWRFLSLRIVEIADCC